MPLATATATDVCAPWLRARGEGCCDSCRRTWLIVDSLTGAALAPCRSVIFPENRYPPRITSGAGLFGIMLQRVPGTLCRSWCPPAQMNSFRAGLKLIHEWSASASVRDVLVQ